MFKSYLKIAFRNVIRYRGYTFINVLGLAIGIACCLLIMLWVTDELGYDKFNANYDRIYRVVSANHDSGQQEYEWKNAAPMAAAMKADFPEISAATMLRPMKAHLFTDENNHTFKEDLYLVEPDFFTIFSFPLAEGDVATALSSPNSVILTRAMAERFYGKESPLGKILRIDGTYEMTVTGVVENVPEKSHLQFDCLAPFVLINKFMAAYGNIINNWGAHGFATYVMLNDPGSAAGLKAKLDGYLAKYDEGQENVLSLQPLSEVYLESTHIQAFNLFAAGDIKYIYIFMSIAVVVLIIACINFMNLTTARSGSRAREVGLRKTAGADRFQIIRQFFGESVLLAVLALMLAVLLVELMLPAFNVLAGKNLTLSFFDSFDIYFMLLAVALVTGLLSGFYPALVLSSFQPVKVLKGTFTAGGKGLTLRKILVVAQFAISITLIISTVLIADQISYIRHKKLGFDKDRLVYLKLDTPTQQRYASLKNELLHQPGIASVTVSSSLPTHGVIFSTTGLDWAGRDENLELLMNAVSVGDDYIETFGMELAEGRFLSAEFGSDTLKEIVLNETAVKVMGLEEPLGKEITIMGITGIVTGVVKDYHFQSMHFTMEPLTIISVPDWYSYVFIRLKSDDLPKTLGGIETVWRKFSPDSPAECRFLEEDYDNLYRAEYRMGDIFGNFTILAIFISCLGLFGLAAYMAEKRTKEIGVRKVLGATVPGLMVMISRDFIKWVLLANLIAWPSAYLLMSRWLTNFAYRTSLGWTIFVLSGALSLAIAVLTVSYQAFRAARINPVKALHYE